MPQTDKQDRQLSDSIGRTVLQTVAQKPNILARLCQLFDSIGYSFRYWQHWVNLLNTVILCNLSFSFCEAA